MVISSPLLTRRTQIKQAGGGFLNRDAHCHMISFSINTAPNLLYRIRFIEKRIATEEDPRRFGAGLQNFGATKS